MRVMVACEFTGTVRNAFAALGHNAWSCDLLPCDDDKHIQADIKQVLRDAPDWDLLIAHPPCTYLCSSGLHWNTRRPERREQTEEAVRFVQWLMDRPVPRVAVENPIGCISTRIRRPEQIVQPWQFGHDASKATCLWLKNLPPLTPTLTVEPRMVGDRPRWANQTDSGQNRLAPSPDRWAARSKTYEGIALAMAQQWGSLS